MTTFRSEFSQLMRESLSNNYKVEPIPYISQALQDPKNKTRTSLKKLRRELVSTLRLLARPTDNAKVNYLSRKLNLDGLTETYNLLDDEQSKKLLVQLIAYRTLGPSKIKLPLCNSDAWLPVLEIEKQCKQNDTHQTKEWSLDLLDLNSIGHDIKYFLKSEGVFLNFFLRQYEYAQCKVEPGDYVIDGGSCFGDMALQFAEATGENGHVFAFEFIKDNIELLNKNLMLNPKLSSRVTLIEQPLWSDSVSNLYIIEKGAASQVVLDEPDAYSQRICTASIDDLVQSNAIPRVDFIKLDIEGAELDCLMGAKNTIQRFKPKLAICLYHNIDHFVSIPKFVKQLVPDYKLYLNHYTAGPGETVMFAFPSTHTTHHS